MKQLTALIQGKYKKRGDDVLRLSCAGITAKVVDRTPVLHGSLRASWTPNKGAPKTNNINIDQGDTGRNNIPAVINSLKAGDTYSLANGQDYVRKIEYEGHSRVKAPQGMLGVSVAEWDSIVNQAVRDAS